MILPVLPSVGAALLAIVLALIVGVRGRGRVANLSFAGSMAGLAGVQAAHAVLLHSGASSALTVAMVAELAMLPAWAVFGVAFGARDVRDSLRSWWWAIALTGALALSFITIGFFRPFVIPVAGGAVPPFTVLGKGTAILALLVSVFVMFHLESTLRSSSGVARWSIKYFILGLFGLFGGHVFVLSQELLVGQVRLDELPVQSAIMVLSLALMMFAIVRYRLLAVDVFISRHAVYHSAVVGVVAIYLIALGLAGEVLSALGMTPDVFMVALVVFASAMLLLAALLSERLRDRLKRAISANFYRHRYDYRREWAEFTAHVSGGDHPALLPARILERLTQTIGIRDGVLWVREPGAQWHLAAAVGTMEEEAPRIDAGALAARRQPANGPIRL